MKAVVAQPSCRKPVECRHFARTAECAWLSETDIIEQNYDHVWRALRCLNLKPRWRFSITSVQFRDGWRLRLGYRQHSAINLLRHQWQWQQARRSDKQTYQWRI